MAPFVAPMRAQLISRGWYFVIVCRPEDQTDKWHAVCLLHVVCTCHAYLHALSYSLAPCCFRIENSNFQLPPLLPSKSLLLPSLPSPSF